MSNTPVNKLSTLDAWVAKLQQKGFLPDSEKTALRVEVMRSDPAILFTRERSFALRKVPPEYVSIAEQRDPGDYERGGNPIHLNSGDFVVFYMNYQHTPIDALGFFNTQGEPLDDIARKIQAKLFD